MLAEHYNDTVLARLHAQLDEAVRMAGNEIIKKRIEFLRTGLNYVPVSRDYLLAKQAVSNGEKGSQGKMTEAGEKRMKWFRETGITWALDIPTLMFYDH